MFIQFFTTPSLHLALLHFICAQFHPIKDVLAARWVRERLWYVFRNFLYFCTKTGRSHSWSRSCLWRVSDSSSMLFKSTAHEKQHFLAYSHSRELYTRIQLFCHRLSLPLNGQRSGVVTKDLYVTIDSNNIVIIYLESDGVGMLENKTSWSLPSVSQVRLAFLERLPVQLFW